MELLRDNHKIFAVIGLVFEKVDQFKYLGATIRSNNNWSVEIVNYIHKAEKESYILLTFLKSKLFSAKSNLRLYMAVVSLTN